MFHNLVKEFVFVWVDCIRWIIIIGFGDYGHQTNNIVTAINLKNKDKLTSRISVFILYILFFLSAQYSFNFKDFLQFRFQNKVEFSRKHCVQSANKASGFNSMRKSSGLSSESRHHHASFRSCWLVVYHIHSQAITVHSMRVLIARRLQS